MILYSRRYDSNKFVEYNIKCEDGEMVYMEIEDFRLNAATCNSRYVLVDFVMVFLFLDRKYTI